MHIGNVPITRSTPPFIIAEIGVNHDGSVDRALDLVMAARRAGASAAKFQFFQTDRLMSAASKLAVYQAQSGESDPIAMLRRLELPIEALARCVARAHEIGLLAIVTVFSTELVAVAESLPWDAYKTASPDIIHRPLIHALAGTGKPLVLSTGAATLDEVELAISWLDAGTLGRTCILQCVSSYPTPLDNACIGAMGALSRIHPGDGPIGYSDHTSEVVTGAIAVAAGATVLEKHLTHDRSARGPDHAASLDPAQFAEYVRLAHAAHAAVRIKVKEVGPLELDVRSLSRQSVVTTGALPSGHTLRATDLTIKRPGSGLAPFLIQDAVGQVTQRAIGADMPVTGEAIRAVRDEGTGGAEVVSASGRPRDGAPEPSAKRVCIVTGSRADFGLLEPVIAAVAKHSRLQLLVIAAGSHLVSPARTIDDVQRACGIDASVPMQSASGVMALGDSRARDAAAVGAGVSGFTEAYADLAPDWVVVLGDRIEAFAAAAAASLAGIAVAHIHGGDRAEGIADEAMRHAISKLAHLHLAATEVSAQRLRSMGEDAHRVLTAGSPAVDGLIEMSLLTDGQAASTLGMSAPPRTVVLLHPSGLPEARERTLAEALFAQIDAECDKPILALEPNHDAGREVILTALRPYAQRGWTIHTHLIRSIFIGVLRRLASDHTPGSVRESVGYRGVLVGNSSAGLIEAAALGVRVLNVGPRQDGRERAGNAIDIQEGDVTRSFGARLRQLLAIEPTSLGGHPYGTGQAGTIIADALDRFDPRDPAFLRKRNSY